MTMADKPSVTVSADPNEWGPTATKEGRPTMAHAIALFCERGERDGTDVRVTDRTEGTGTADDPGARDWLGRHWQTALDYALAYGQAGG